MRFFEVSKDGGSESHVDGFFLIEIKSLFSIALLRFKEGTREAFHSHAFNALTLWLKGTVEERVLGEHGEESHLWAAGQLKFTPRNLCHKIIGPRGDVWAISFRGPWRRYWREYLPATDEFVTLTNGRQVVATLPAGRKGRYAGFGSGM